MRGSSPTKADPGRHPIGQRPTPRGHAQPVPEQLGVGAFSPSPPVEEASPELDAEEPPAVEAKPHLPSASQLIYVGFLGERERCPGSAFT